MAPGVSRPSQRAPRTDAGTRVRASNAQARKEMLWFYVLISPWLAGYILFTGGPTLASFYLSFTHNDPVNWPPRWIGLTNYQVMFADRIFWKSLQVTSLYTLLAVPLSVGFATFIALLLNERLPGQSVWRDDVLPAGRRGRRPRGHHVGLDLPAPVRPGERDALLPVRRPGARAG